MYYSNTHKRHHNELEVFSEDIPRAVLWYNCGTKWLWGVVRETAGKAEGTELLCFLSGTHRSLSPRSVQLFHLHCTLVWLFFRKTRVTIFTTPRPWLWLVGTTVQMMPGHNRFTDTRQVREYPDSTISKVLTVLKWQISQRLIGNCWKSRGYRTALLPMRYT